MLKGLLLVAILAVGCGSSAERDDDDSSVSVICDGNLEVAIPDGTFTMHVCLDYGQLSGSEARTVQDSCAKKPYNGALIEVCPAEDQLGLCTIETQGMTVKEYMYASDVVTAETAKSGCEDAGNTWTPK